MRSTACDVIGRFGGIATTAQLLTVMTRQQLDVQVRKGGLVKVWKGVYAARTPDLAGRLDALDLFVGRPVVACMGTAAALYGFDFENTTSVHVLDPGIRLRSKVGLTVHQRTGAPLRRVAGRLATSPAWTAVEVARQLPRPRALAVLDGALASGRCTHDDLGRAVWEQVGRRGIVRVRGLLPLAHGRAESAMESEARLVFIDYGLPMPELQFEIRGPSGESWRVDFAWPEQLVVAEYESVAWHTGRAEMLRDKRRSAGIQQLDWTYIPIVVDDVRVEPWRLADRVSHHLSRPARAS